MAATSVSTSSWWVSDEGDGHWKRDGLVVWRPFKALLFADKKAFHWIKEKLGLSEYQMAALVWVKGVIVGLLLAFFLF